MRFFITVFFFRLNPGGKKTVTFCPSFLFFWTTDSFVCDNMEKKPYPFAFRFGFWKCQNRFQSAIKWKDCQIYPYGLFFPSGFSREKKNRDEKIAIFLKPVPFFALFGARAQFWFTVFFFPAPNPEGKKNRKIGLWRGRKEDECDNLEK